MKDLSKEISSFLHCSFRFNVSYCRASVNSTLIVEGGFSLKTPCYQASRFLRLK